MFTTRTSRNQKGCLQPGKSYKIVEHTIHRANTPRHFVAKFWGQANFLLPI